MKNIRGLFLKEFIKNYVIESARTKRLVLEDDELLKRIEQAVLAIIKAYKNDNKLLLAGNGGSAADAQHIAAELVSKFLCERKALSAMALTTNTSILTSIGNDYSHDLVFARQIQAHGKKGDVFIAISTSGNSSNIVEGAKEAKKRGLFVISLTGDNECELDKISDIIIKVPSANTPVIQESHIMIGHIICALVEKQLV